MKDVEVYIGTSLRTSQKGTGRVIYLMKTYKANGTPYESAPEIAEYDKTTESGLTLYAIRDALGRLNYPCRVIIYTECIYIAAAISQGWPAAWQKSQWRGSKGEPVKDAELWRDVMEAAQAGGHELTAEKGKHEWTEWMAWNMTITTTLKNVFKTLPKT